jgi:rSAM/selenodomain-associated transferase 1
MSCAIAVMAKAPQPGRCKTRLMPRLSPPQAAALSAAFLRDVTGNLQAASRGASIDAFVAYAPAGTGPLFDGMLAPGTGLILADGSIDGSPGVLGFGTCLLHALRALFALGHESACVLNADSPNLPTAYLRQAAAALSRPGDRVVLGPAEDGGYYLLGVKQTHAGLFADIDWSTPQVCDQTLARARTLGLETELLPPWYDVDEPASLDRLIAAFDDGTEPEGYLAPATRLALRQMVPRGF